jgi:cob(I)alamin adenosyltransferase
MYPKLIRRNATRQQAAIFSQIKSVKGASSFTHYTPVDIADLGCIQREYVKYSFARLTQISENEYHLRITSDEWYTFSTEEIEAIAPATTEATQEIASVEIQPEVAKPESKIVPQPVKTEEAIAPTVEPTQETEQPLEAMQAELSAVQVDLAKCWDVINALEDYRENFTGLEKTLNEALTKSIWARIDDMEAKVKQLTAKILAAKEKQKAQIVSINLKQWERRGELEEVTVTTWQEANAVLSKWASSIDYTSYNKCEILFTSADSHQFKMRFDYTRDCVWKMDLAQELTTELKFLSGDRPSHMSEKDYQEYLRMCKIDTIKYQQLIKNWEIPA